MDAESTGGGLNLIYVILGLVAAILVVIIFMYLALKKKMQNSDVKRINQLRAGTGEKKFNAEVLYQKLYVRYLKTPFLKRYLFKIRRRIEINNLDDEFLTRQQSAQIITKALVIIIPFTVVVIFITHSNLLLMGICLIFELFIIDSATDGMVDKLDNNLLYQQMDFFAQMRHSYHETNMVGEAIYVTAQDTDHIEIARQAEKIYEILNSSDPEMELEKYYDVSPNNYLKEFAGISYLTQEFGDRKMNGESLYLRNLENITQEMQLEILKRDKLNYTFQSLSIISIAPMLLLEPLKNWGINNFAFTKSFFLGKAGLIVQILIMVLTFVCYILVRRLKDNGSVKRVENNQNPWQAKIYSTKFGKKIVDEFMPKKHTADYRKEHQLLKDAASKQKLEWVYVNRLCLFVLCFVCSFIIVYATHLVQVDYILTQPTTDYNLIANLEGNDYIQAMKRTEKHNAIIKKFRGNRKATTSDLVKYMKKSPEYKDSSESTIKKESEKIYEKLQKINDEYVKWYEVLFAMVIGYLGYAAPMLLLKFQVKMRKMAMEDEVMSYQVIILMLMRLERVDVEMILEWLERYADIFKDPISKCLNNYESGAWESLEAMKDDVSYQEFLRIIESLQSAVEKVPIRDAFEELDSDRDYYKNKRRETNERLIKKKGMIGKIIGFAPMVVVFIGYLIVPLVFMGFTSMSSSFDSMSSMDTT